MAVARRGVPLRLVVLLLGAHAACLACARLSHAQTTYRARSALGTEWGSITSSSGLALVTTHYQPWKYENASYGATKWLWAVPDGDELTGTDAVVAGFYVPSTQITDAVWTFGTQAVTGVTATSSPQMPTAVYPNPEWDNDPEPFDEQNRLVINGGPWIMPQTVYSEGSRPPPWPSHVVWREVPGSKFAVELWIDYTSYHPGGGSTPGWRTWAATAPAGTIWTKAITGPPSSLVPVPPDPFRVARFEIVPDPIKAGDGPGGGYIDLQPLMDQLDSYYGPWNAVYDELFEQLTGGSTEMDWIARDARRDGYLAEVRDNTTTANALLSAIGSQVNSANSRLSTINGTLGLILQAIQPTQIPPTVTPLGETMPLPELAFEDIEEDLPDTETLLPDEWQQPSAPPERDSDAFVWEIVVPLSTIPFFSGMPNWEFEVDMEPFDDIVRGVRAVLILVFTIGCVYSVIDETRKR